MVPSGDNFERDGLKQAMKRAFPAKHAPQALRERVASMLQDEEMWTNGSVPEPVKLTQPAGPIAVAPASIAWLGNFFHGARRVALAACFAGLAMGVALFVSTHSFTTSDTPSEQLADAGQIPPFVQAALGRHDELLQAADPSKAANVSLAPVPEVQRRMATPMPDPDIATQGWQALGAKTLQTSGGTGAQIFYRRGADTLSVFIIPPDGQGRPIRMATSNLRNHLVAAREGARFTVCVVGQSPDGKLTAQEVERIAEMIASH